MTTIPQVAAGPFPILLDWRERKASGAASIPWAVIAPHEDQANRNHHQTLKRLAERGGLGWCEAAAVLENRAWRSMPDNEAKATVERIVREHLINEGISHG